MNLRYRIFVIVGCLLAIFLQIALAPHIALFAAMPNFIVAYAMLLSVVRRRSYGCVLPFIMGLLFDLMSGGPVGAMAFTLTLVSMFASRAFLVLDNDTMFMPAVIMAVGLLAVELFYALFLAALGYNAGLMELFVYRALPCFVYDLVVALLLYPVVSRLLVIEEPTHHDVMQLR